MKIEVVENVLKYNKDQAEKNRKIFSEKNILVINILSSPGAGKTSLIIETIRRLKDIKNIGVIEGDISSTHDAEKIKHHIDEVVQINTGGSCHLNATMIDQALARMDLDMLDIIIIENVGNLICPVGFDLGEDYKVVLSSVNEGDDKPIKYPPVFIKSNPVLLNKIDLLGISDFDLDFFKNEVKKINPMADFLMFSCKTSEGLGGWINWISENTSTVKYS